MRTTIILSILLLFFLRSIAQDVNPFESIGKEGKILTLSKGKYLEIENNDSLQRIGSVIVNMNTGQLYEILDTDTLYQESDLNPTIITRWWSIDPMASKFPSMSPYAVCDNNPIIYNDPTGEYSIKVIAHDDGTMELRIVSIGYLEGQLSKKINDEFHASYPNGYQDQGSYYDKAGTKWTITVQIDLSTDPYNPKKGSVIHADCYPPVNEFEDAPVGGFEVCAAGHAGLALHGLWHNIGGDDCYQGDGMICKRDGLMNNPNIPLTDFFQIGFNFIDLIPENLNSTPNTKKQSITDYIQSKGSNFEYSNVYQGEVPFAWDGSFERNDFGSLQDLMKIQMDQHIKAEFPDTCEPPSRDAPSIEYKPGEPVNN